MGRAGIEPATLGLRVEGEGFRCSRALWETPLIEPKRLASVRAFSRRLVDLVLTRFVVVAVNAGVVPSDDRRQTLRPDAATAPDVRARAATLQPDARRPRRPARASSLRCRSHGRTAASLVSCSRVLRCDAAGHAGWPESSQRLRLTGIPACVRPCGRRAAAARSRGSAEFDRSHHAHRAADARCCAARVAADAVVVDDDGTVWAHVPAVAVLRASAGEPGRARATR